MRTFALVLAMLVCTPLVAHAVPGTVPFKARLEDNGSPLTGPHDFSFQLYDAATAGEMVWEETDASLDVADGLLVHEIGGTTPLDDAVSAGEKLWLEIRVDGVLMEPRLALASVPFALAAGTAEHADRADDADNADAIGGHDVATTAPDSGDVMKFNGTSWTPSSNYVDLTSPQTVGGNKQFTGNLGVGIAPTAVKLDVNGESRLRGLVRGTLGGGGVYLADRAGDNGISFDWHGVLDFYVENVLVKTFVIDHPVDRAKYLVHATLEGPESAVYYRGTAQLENGVAEVALPPYFEAEAREDERTVLVTPIFEGMDDPVSALAASRVRRGAFVVRAIDGRNRAQRFDWEVKAVRKDVPRLTVEPARNDVVMHGDGPYRYLTPR
ncbi:MAG TPA: hypothetical protein VMZ28_09625 [Kofleriaceae bacterium]|nr:hypothetical protein [Kofleriaceae bacterium]